MRDLVALTISAVEACACVEDWLPGALPVPISPGRPLTRKQLAKLQEGRKKQRDKMKNMRKLYAEKKVPPNETRFGCNGDPMVQFTAKPEKICVKPES